MPDPASILSSLVPFRSDIVGGEERPLAEHLAELLRARRPDDVVVAEVPRPEGPPTSWVYARYGRPTPVNAHLDTVPPNTDWSSDPFVPRIEAGRMHALGASDTKGAAAAILAALEEVRPTNVGVLFSGDEEFSSVAMRAFLAGEHRAGLERAIVCEPTNLRAGVRHRGIVAFEVTVSGPGGHSSPPTLAGSHRRPLAAWRWRSRLARPLKTVGPPGFPACA